ncbi:MAG: hypothetical protein HY054_13210, partial [Proteobacteria bacterium]|nr:hypothetical protein [Pseudomonadota bacterium]
SIFAKPQASGFWRLTKPAYKNTALTKALTETLDDRSLGDESLKTGLAIHAKRIDTGSAWILVNNPDWRYFGVAPGGDAISNGSLQLRDLVQASAAAPTYFLPVEMSIGPRHGNKKVVATLVDGGVSPNNNPALQMLTTATDPAFGFQWNTGEENLLLWSIGTGYVRKQFRKPDRKRRSSALPMSKFRAYSSKVQAALEGYNHDISQQHITIMQALSRPRFPWYVNSEIRSQSESPLLSGEPALCYQRYDARLEIDNADMRRPEHIEELVGREMKAAEVAKLREMDISDPELLDTLYRAGEALGAAQLIHRDTRDDHHPVRGAALAQDWPPARFDPPTWRSAPSGPEAAAPEQA